MIQLYSCVVSEVDKWVRSVFLGPEASPVVSSAFAVLQKMLNTWKDV